MPHCKRRGRYSIERCRKQSGRECTNRRKPHRGVNRPRGLVVVVDIQLTLGATGAARRGHLPPSPWCPGHGFAPLWGDPDSLHLRCMPGPPPRSSALETTRPRRTWRTRAATGQIGHPFAVVPTTVPGQGDRPTSSVYMATGPETMCPPRAAAPAAPSGRPVSAGCPRSRAAAGWAVHPGPVPTRGEPIPEREYALGPPTSDEHSRGWTAATSANPRPPRVSRVTGMRLGAVPTDRLKPADGPAVSRNNLRVHPAGQPLLCTRSATLRVRRSARKCQSTCSTAAALGVVRAGRAERRHTFLVSWPDPPPHRKYRSWSVLCSAPAPRNTHKITRRLGLPCALELTSRAPEATRVP